MRLLNNIKSNFIKKLTVNVSKIPDVNATYDNLSRDINLSEYFELYIEPPAASSKYYIQEELHTFILHKHLTLHPNVTNVIISDNLNDWNRSIDTLMVSYNVNHPIEDEKLVNIVRRDKKLEVASPPD